MKRLLKSFVIISFVATCWSQTTGKLSGTVKGDDGTPLAGANVFVSGTGSGASSNADGTFQILNVPQVLMLLKQHILDIRRKR